jgi:addiction module RelE/StbE family toxin
MSWAFEFTQDAKRDLSGLPKPIQRRIARVLDLMAHDPFQGDAKPLHGNEWKGVFRRRLGDYRLLFTCEPKQSVVRVLRILVRSGATYR